MIANIFVCDRSFAFNGTDTIDDLRRKILGMRNLFATIEERRFENYLYLQHNNFIDTVISNDGDTIGRLIFGSDQEKLEMKAKYSRDVYDLVLSLFNRTERSIFSHEDMVAFLSEEYEEKDVCYGVVAMNHLDEFQESKQVLFDDKGFYKFRRYYIGKLINDAEIFREQIEAYYPNLIFNMDRALFKNNLKEVVESHGVCIINCLTALSENFTKEFSGQGGIEAPNLSVFLRSFAKSNNIDDGSFEGTHKKKELNCTFHKTRKDACGETITLYCGPHLKMYHDDNNRKDCHMRVYFAWDKDNFDVIYIGMITSHV